MAAAGAITGRVHWRGAVPDPDFDPVVAAVMHLCGTIAFEDMRRRFQPHNKTNRTMEAMELERKGAEGFRLWNPLETAGWIEFGTPAHDIDPHTARRRVTDENGHTTFRGGVLRWYDNGTPIFATHVDHPGTDADPFMEPAVTENADVFEELLYEGILAEWSGP